jgi:hypothetical protein
MMTSMAKKGPLFQKIINSFFANGAVIGDAAVAMGTSSQEYRAMIDRSIKLYQEGKTAEADALYESFSKTSAATNITEQQTAMSRLSNLTGDLSTITQDIYNERLTFLRLQQQDTARTANTVTEVQNTRDGLTRELAKIEEAGQRLKTTLDEEIQFRLISYLPELTKALNGQLEAIRSWTANLSGADGEQFKPWTERFMDWMVSVYDPDAAERARGVPRAPVTNTAGAMDLSSGAADIYAGARSDSPNPPASTPRRAGGGIVTEPSIAGEAGPEAVVPLINGGRIPVNLDLGPLTALLERQTRQNDEIMRYLRESVEIQERIYSVQA